MCNEVPAGYQLHINTWENDGDYKTTQIISGLIEEDVRFYIDLAECFYSRHGFSRKGHGNGCVEEEVLTDIIQSVLAKHPNISQDTHDIWDGDINDNYDLIIDYVLGCPQSESYMDGCFCRVYENCRVFFIEKPISDVTKQFK